MKVKIFNNGLDIETEINKWIEENPSFIINSISVYPLYDLYSGQSPTVCNQWIGAMVIYSESEPISTCNDCDPTGKSFCRGDCVKGTGDWRKYINE